MCFLCLWWLKPIASDVAPEREAAPLVEPRVITRNLLVVRFPAVVSELKESRAGPRIQRQPVITSQQLQEVLGGVVSDALHALDLLNKIERRQFARKPRLHIQ